MSERDIKGNLLAVRELIDKALGSDLPPEEREVIKTLVITSLNLLEGLLIDINRIANAAESYRG